MRSLRSAEATISRLSATNAFATGRDGSTICGVTGPHVQSQASCPLDDFGRPDGSADCDG